MAKLRGWIYRLAEGTTETVDRRDFGLRDRTLAQKTVGALVVTAEFEARAEDHEFIGATKVFDSTKPLGRDEAGYERFAPYIGTVYCYETSALRNGKGFGASTHWNLFSTREERDVAVAKYWKSAERTARKNFAR